MERAEPCVLSERAKEGEALRRLAMRTRKSTPTPQRACPIEQQIRYWMRTPAITLNLGASVSEALVLMCEHNVRRLPIVLDSGELCGIITQGDIRGADLLRAAGLAPQVIGDALRQLKVSDVMAEGPVVVTPATSLREAALLMIEHKIGGLPVVSHSGEVVGIITESDLFEALVQQLDRETVAA
jgi:acetoin utilization protein AcuB/CBS domain-containing protein